MVKTANYRSNNRYNTINYSLIRFYNQISIIVKFFFVKKGGFYECILLELVSHVNRPEVVAHPTFFAAQLTTVSLDYL